MDTCPFAAAVGGHSAGGLGQGRMKRVEMEVLGDRLIVKHIHQSRLDNNTYCIHNFAYTI